MPRAKRDMLGYMVPNTQRGEGKRTHDSACAPPCTCDCPCPACGGLECLERPRYFAGQLLTEAELQSEQHYQIAKNKLHNRYLHGWGVVCGLEVVCHPCDGWVTVRPGYALDPCGNDIIVCEAEHFDVAKAIRDCAESRRRRRDCDPMRTTNPPQCEDLEEHYCLTIAYEEKEARPITALRNEKPHGGGSCGCGCGSNGNGKGGGCGCGGGVAKSASAATKVRSGVGTTVAACEPTRIYERYRLQLVDEPECAGGVELSDTDPRLLRTRYKYFTFIENEETRRALFRLIRHAPPDSAFMRVINCITCLFEFIEKRVPREELRLLPNLLFTCLRLRNRDPQSFIGAFDSQLPVNLYSLCCHLQRAVDELYAQNPLNVHCTYECKPCSPPTPSGYYPSGYYPSGYFPSGQYPGGPQGNYTLLESLCCLFDRLIQYAIDCFCSALLPPCPPSPADDRVILACLTVKNGKVIDICNLACRRYAGSFPAVNYWLSFFPIIPVIRDAFKNFCCDFDLFELFGGYTYDRRYANAAQTARTTDTQTTETTVTLAMSDEATSEATDNAAASDAERETRERASAEARARQFDQLTSDDAIDALRSLGSLVGMALRTGTLTNLPRRAREREERSKSASINERAAAESSAEVEKLRAQVETMRHELDELKNRG